MKQLSLKDQAYLTIKQSILDNTYKVNSILTERTIAEQLQMSRTPVRSAIERLESEGYLLGTPNKGFLLKDLSLKQIVDFFDFRIAIEPYVAEKLAGKSFTDADLQWFSQNLQSQENFVLLQDTINFTKLDSEFHRHLIKCYDNEEMFQTLEHLQDKLYRIALNVLQKDHSRIHQSISDHQHIWEAIITGNKKNAGDEMRQHLEFGKRILVG